MSISHCSIKHYLLADLRDRARPRSRGPSSAEAYLDAQKRIEDVELDVARQQRGLARRLLRADRAYQRAVAELSFHGAGDDLPRSLTGPLGVVDGLLAVRKLVSTLRETTNPPWSPELLDELLPAVKDLLEVSLPDSAVDTYEAARRSRAETLGALLESGRLPYDRLRSAPALAPADGARGPEAQSSVHWADSVVRVQTTGARPAIGSGVFLNASQVLTAAHVVHRAETVEVSSPTLEMAFQVIEARTHPGYPENRVSCDYAIIEVEPAPGMGHGVLWDFGGMGGSYPVHRLGFPTHGDRYGTGSVERLRRMFLSSDLRVPHGSSGGGLFYEWNWMMWLVGITTNEDAPSRGDRSYVGLALIEQVLDEI